MKLQPKPTRCPWPNVQSFEQDGKWRHYYRKRHAPRIALPAGDWRTREFKEAYEAAKTRAVMGLATLPATNLKAQLATLPPDSFEALARALLKSKRFAQLAPKTRKEGTRIINTICGLPASTDPNHPAHKFPFGEYTARDLKPKHFLTLRDRKEDTPQEADDWLNWCQKIYAHAIPRELGGVETNPVRDVERFKQQSKQIEPWSRQDIEVYRARWAIGTDERLAFEIFWNGAQRMSDTWDISRSDIKGGSFDYVQFKGRTRKAGRRSVLRRSPSVPDGVRAA
jgi:hypothetical protein